MAKGGSGSVRSGFALLLISSSADALGKAAHATKEVNLLLWERY